MPQKTKASYIEVFPVPIVAEHLAWTETLTISIASRRDILEVMRTEILVG
jgi:hypothetical protein